MVLSMILTLQLPRPTLKSFSCVANTTWFQSEEGKDYSCPGLIVSIQSWILLLISVVAMEFTSMEVLQVVEQKSAPRSTILHFVRTETFRLQPLKFLDYSDWIAFKWTIILSMIESTSKESNVKSTRYSNELMVTTRLLTHL